MKKEYFAILKFIFRLLIIFLPSSAFAATTLNFDPPPSDVSVTFLTDIFGVVDGVLSGGGSQIMGSMFAIFNASILALGGMILIYTTVVATLNTAGEGQVLGKNWSSIWIPIRTTLGLSLLFTYPSGYSVLQIFVMWIVVQGVGAADLIWNAALGYLQRGGVIVQPMPTQAQQESAMVSSANMMQGASVMLTGIACMEALQQQLQTLQTTYLNELNQSGTGPCVIPTSGTLTQDQQNMSVLCNNAIPDFVNSTNVMQAQTEAMDSYTNCTVPTSSGGTENCETCVNSSNQQCSKNSAGCTCTANPNCQNNAGSVTCSTNTSSATGPVVLPMPNLEEGTPYAPLNGICGTITWNLMDSSEVQSTAEQLGVSTQDAAMMENSRAIAVQQMFSDLTPVAQDMVQNDLTLYSTSQITCNTAGGVTCYFNTTSYTPSSPFGVPATDSGSFSCDGLNNPVCTQWVSPQTGFSPLLNGTELWGAVEDYNSIMEPTLNAEDNTSTIKSSTRFIDQAEADGWIVAGSYFFNLENVNSSDATYTSSSTGIYDTDSGLNSSTYPPGLSSSFCAGVGGSDSLVCTWYGGGNSSNSSVVNIYNGQMSSLIQGPTPTQASAGTPTPAPTYSATQSPVNSTNWPVIYSNTDERNTTVYGYSSNASNLVTAGQQGSSIPQSTFKPTLGTPQPPTWSYNCSSGLFGYYDIAGDICLLLGENLFSNFMNWIWNLLSTIITTVIVLLLLFPIEIFSGVFMQTIENMNNNPANPIVALTTSGAQYVNLCIETWIVISLALAAEGMIPLASGIILVIVVVIGPFIYTWLGLVFGIGVIMAYFIPMIPYVLFTFGALGWLMGVIEAMVAAPIVALGVMLPEGHDVFGQGKDALMLIFYAFLRPSMMIIGYIAGIILASVGIWVINAGFTQFTATYIEYSGINPGGHDNTIAYIIAFLFLFFVYVSMCFYVIEQAFEMIYRLPDGILRWIGGGTQEAFGAGVAGKGLSEAKGQVKEAGDATKGGASQKRSFGEEEDKKKPEGKGGVGGSAGGGGGGGGGIHLGSSGGGAPPIPPVV